MELKFQDAGMAATMTRDDRVTYTWTQDAPTRSLSDPGMINCAARVMFGMKHHCGQANIHVGKAGTASGT